MKFKVENTTITVEVEAGELERLRKDAGRYLWLRDTHPADGGLWVAMGVPGSPAGVACWREEALDAAIDAAMGKKP
jgi:hypothetical protein